MTQQQHGGFFASVPRIVRTQYKDLSASEKWLYTCLKDLCGDRGTCFRNLRTLSIETSLSTGSLSTMIPNLHKAGLIHAEKKPRGLGGKEVWHISIVDIWQSNAAYCSGIEQPGISIVQGLNNQVPVVQNMNEEVEYCSNSEPSCSNFDDRRRLLEEEKIEEDISLRANEQQTEPFLVPALPLRDELSNVQSSYSHEPAAPSPDKSEWLWESEGEADIFSEDADPTEKRPAITHERGGNLAPGEKRATKESEDRREGSNEHPAVKPPLPGQPPASPGQAAKLREQPTAQSIADEKPRQPTRTPEPEASKPPLSDKTQEKGNRKKDAPLLCETSKIRKLIDATRGHALEDPGALINQSKIIHAWCEKHPIEHATLVLHHIMTSTCKKHVWWQAHLDAFSAKALAQLTSEILPELGIIPKPELPPDIPMPAASSPPNGKYHPYTRASMYEPIEIGV